MARLYDAAKVVRETDATLKDFQMATVDRVMELFSAHRNRVLVADEVGLGKTVVARGVIARFAELREREGDDFVTVAYICSNQAIARQNIEKLRVCGEVYTGDKKTHANESRLSMQHLRIAEIADDDDIQSRYVQLVPLTPDTSFRLTQGNGLREERALMFATLKYAFGESVARGALTDADRVCAYWDSLVERYLERIGKLKANGRTLHCRFRQDLLANGACELARVGNISGLRQVFARCSVSMLKPDLVVMDEFQRFKYLLEASEKDDDEAGILVRRFLTSPDPQQETRVLLLSATPYKPYSTAAEVAETGEDSSQREFLDLLTFLFEGRDVHAQEIWADYTHMLLERTSDGTAVLEYKRRAEAVLREAVCRTERISVMETGDYISDEGCRRSVGISEGDISAYLEFSRLLGELDIPNHLPVDYAKSCPYLMSFLNGYAIKKRIEGTFTGHVKSKVARCNRKSLWVTRSDIAQYKKLAPSNARLEALKGQVFQGKSDLFMWVPPTLPYYPMAGVYKDAGMFSKVLVFSSWEMVPRMIATLVSYEAEVRTVGRLLERHRGEDIRGASYFAKDSRYPSPRLRPEQLSSLALLYPSRTLAGIWDPVDTLNRRLDLNGLLVELRQKVAEALAPVRKVYCREETGREDSQWYALAPMLMDGADTVRAWAVQTIKREREKEEARQSRGFVQLCEKVLEIFSGEVHLGRPPEDLARRLVDMTLGSFAVCTVRRLGFMDGGLGATDVARCFYRRFNSGVATAIVELAYSRFKDQNHWQDVLAYCRDGCFQAMFDEYFAVVAEESCFVGEEERLRVIVEKMCDALTLRTSTYDVDTYPALEGRIYPERHPTGAPPEGMSMRSHFAVGFSKDKESTEKGANRKEGLRKSFNSPLWPFVLASTSIGQEGLDFHPYCRKIFHWNLPTNPVDLEQREGRINRYKCLAVRESAVLKYRDRQFSSNVWDEIYAAAAAEKPEGVPDLIPFWCFGKDQRVKIERFFPMYPCSRDQAAYARLIRILAIYRLSMGQPRQEELLEHVLKEYPAESAQELKRLFINLSPFMQKRDERHG